MSETIVNEVPESDVKMDTSEINFDNLTIIKEFSNIINLVSDSMFIESVPKGKMKRVQWMPMFNYFKQNALDEMVEELNSMWKFENMQQKLQILEKQKEKFANLEESKTLWRPQLGDIKSQLKAHDYANLLKQKSLLETISREYESEITKLQKTLSGKRGYLKILLMDIKKYDKKCDDVLERIDYGIKKHDSHVKQLLPDCFDKEIDIDCDDNL